MFSCLSAFQLRQPGKGKGKGKGKGNTDAAEANAAPLGSMVQVLFSDVPMAADCIKRINSLGRRIEGADRRVWANYQLSDGQKAVRFQIHKAKDFLENILIQAAQGQPPQEIEKRMGRLSIEVQGEVVLTVFKGELLWKPAAQAYFTTE